MVSTCIFGEADGADAPKPITKSQRAWNQLCMSGPTTYVSPSTTATASYARWRIDALALSVPVAIAAGVLQILSVPAAQVDAHMHPTYAEPLGHACSIGY